MSAIVRLWFVGYKALEPEIRSFDFASSKVNYLNTVCSDRFFDSRKDAWDKLESNSLDDIDEAKETSKVAMKKLQDAQDTLSEATIRWAEIRRGIALDEGKSES